jgi:zinc and cadmium transporter
MHPFDIHWVYTFASVAIVAGASLIGMVALSFDAKRLAGLVPFLVSLAAGALLGTALGHLLPESVERLGTGKELSALLLAGFITFFVLEKALGLWCEGHPRIPGHRHLSPADLHPHASMESDTQVAFNSARPIITNLLVGAGIHSFVDGMVIATGYTTGTSLGMITTFAVLLHEAPHHIGDVSILIHKGIPVMRAVFLNLIAASGSAVGALLVLLIGTRLMSVTSVLLPFTTANFLYIASASLMPELQQERGLRQSFTQTILFVVGSLVMFVSSGASDTQ